MPGSISVFQWNFGRYARRFLVLGGGDADAGSRPIEIMQMAKPIRTGE